MSYRKKNKIYRLNFRRDRNVPDRKKEDEIFTRIKRNNEEYSKKNNNFITELVCGDSDYTYYHNKRWQNNYLTKNNLVLNNQDKIFQFSKKRSGGDDKKDFEITNCNCHPNYNSTDLILNNRKNSFESDKNIKKTNQKLKLKRIISPIIRQYKMGIKKHQKQLKLDINKNFISLKNKKMKNAYYNRGYYDYFGIVYRIIDRRNGKLLYGFTLESLESRWRNYKRFAIKNRNSDYLLPIEMEILKVIDKKMSPDEIFIIQPVEICFNYNILRKRERFWISRHDTMNPKRGYNSNKGGGGGPKVKIPMEIVAKYIAIGYKSTEITDLLEKNYGIYMRAKTLSRRINEYWGSKLRAQKMFLKPVIVKLIIEGYCSKNIIDILGSHGRNILDRIIPKMFDGMSFSNLRAYYLTQIVENLIIKGLGQKEMADILRGFGEKEIYNRINEKWGNLQNARATLWKPIIIKKLISNRSGKDILISLGYAESTAIRKHNEVICRLFNGMNTEQARQHFKNLNSSLNF